MITSVINRREVQDGADGSMLADLESALKDVRLYGTSEGHLVPPILQPREIVELAYEAGWHDAKQLWIATAVCLAESQGYAGSYNDNLDKDGKVLSRDVGPWQINIPALSIGTQVEHVLYDPVKNAQAAFKLWGTGSHWGRWASHSSGVYLHPYYAARAELGVMNWLAAFGDSLGSTVSVPIWTISELRAKVVW